MLSVTTRRVLVLVATAMLAATLAACAPVPSANPGNCGWPNKNDTAAANIAYPDTNATYFVMPYALSFGQQLVVHGAYPSARYFSFITYSLDANVIDHIADTAIDPDPGSGNPFTDAAAPADAAHRKYTVTVSGGAAPVGSQTALSGGGTPVLSVGLLMLRVYLPNDPGDLSGSGGLPSLSYRNIEGSEQAITTCATQGVSPLIGALAAVLPPADKTPPATPVFTRAPFASLFPNPDNAYLAALTSYQPGRVVVVRGKAATFPDTTNGQPVTSPTQLRYYSMCQNTYVSPYPVVQCAADTNTSLDASGYYTYVISTPSDRPANAVTANAVTWLPWGDTTKPGFVVLRNMLPATTFHQATQDVPAGQTPNGIMDDYAPVAHYCAVSAFAAGGPAACGF